MMRCKSADTESQVSAANLGAADVKGITPPRVRLDLVQSSFNSVISNNAPSAHQRYESSHLTPAAVLEAITQSHEPRRRELRAYQVRVVPAELPLDGRYPALVCRTGAVHR